MRIASRLTLLVTLAIVGVGAIHAAWSIDRVLDRLEDGARKGLTAQARTMAAGVAAIWDSKGRAGVLTMVDEVDAELGRRVVDWHDRGTIEPGFRRGEAGLTVVAPVVVDGVEVGAISVLKDAAELDAERRDAIVDRSVAAALMIFACGVVLFVATRSVVSRPLSALAGFTRTVGSGDLSQRVEPARLDEIGALAVEMNAMAEGLLVVHRRIEDEAARRIAAQQALRHAERLKTVGQLTAGFAHELGTPLNVIMGRARLISRGRVAGDALVETAEIIRDQARRMAGLVKDLLTFARRGPADDAPVDLIELIEHSARLLAPLAKKAGVALAIEPGPTSAIVQGNAQALEQVIANLVMNGVQAGETGGQVALRVELVSETPTPVYALYVTDDGSGMAPDVVEHIFDPFFSTKDVGEGTGLGLSVVYGIVRDHEGEIEVESVEGAGSTFTVRLPATRG